jgi:hypothetical protein
MLGTFLIVVILLVVAAAAVGGAYGWGRVRQQVLLLQKRKPVKPAQVPVVIFYHIAQLGTASW